jgi:hypothetical protein
LVNIFGIETLPETCPVIFTLPMVLAATALDVNSANDAITAAQATDVLSTCLLQGSVFTDSLSQPTWTEWCEPIRD